MTSRSISRTPALSDAHFSHEDATERRSQPPRSRGMLAFLPAAGERYPYHADYWRKMKVASGGGGSGARRSARIENTSRSTRKRQRSRRLMCSEVVEDEPSSETVSLVEWFHGDNDEEEESNGSIDTSKDVAGNGSASVRLVDSRRNINPAAVMILFCYDPDQSYSFAVRNRLLGLVDGVARRQGGDSPSLRLRCVAISSAPQTSPGGVSETDFLRHTGFVSIPLSSQLVTLGILPTHTPGLAVYRNHKKISGHHEELGLEWNSVDYVLSRWDAGQSALSCAQQALATIVFPASCAVL